jgi:menaquinone-dependent protoporphyrinogen oxidase
MRILVAVATKHGATYDIAEAISDELRLNGFDSVTAAVEDTTLDGFEAAVLGSALYVGHWRKTATDFLRRNEQRLRTMPVWLFSSGPVGGFPAPEENPVDAADLVAATGARDHRVFGGMLDRRRLSFTERAVTTALHVPAGDFRNFDAVRAWADGIAEALRTR